MAKIKLEKELSELHILTVADEKEWKQAQDKALKILAKDLEIKGFRKGKVPIIIAMKNISSEKILSKAISSMLDTLVKVAAKEIKDDVVILGSPTYSVDKISDVELEITFIYPVYPEFKVAKYKELDIKFEEEKVDNKKVDEEIKKIQEQYSKLIEKDSEIVNGDTVIFDFSGFVDDKPFEGGKSDNYSLVIGSGQFIPGFEEQMIGLKKGEEKDLKVKFPDEYHSIELKGKEVIFKVKINEIKTKIIPELNEEFILKLAIKDVKNISELKIYMSDILKQQANQNARETFKNKAFKILVKKTKVNLPKSLIAAETIKQEEKFTEMIKKENLSMEQYIKMIGGNKTKMEEQFLTSAKEQLKESLIFAEIARIEKINISDEDYNAEYIKLAKVYRHSEKSIKGLITKSQMQIPMINDKVLSILINSKK